MKQKSIAWHLATSMMVMALVGLAGCTPQYDWRMVSLGDGQVRAMFPDKPRTSEREFEFEGHAITFSLTSASVNDVLFTVGYASLPDPLQKEPSARKRLVRQVQASLYQNLGAQPPDVMPAAVSQFVVESVAAQDPPLRLEAVVWATDQALIEGIVLGVSDTLPRDQVNEFLRELAPDLRPSPERGTSATAS